MRDLLRRSSKPASGGHGVPLLALAAGVVFVVSVLGAAITSTPSTTDQATPASTTATTEPRSPETMAPARPAVSGFSGISILITSADGSRHPACALLAESPKQQEVGLMHRDDLGGYDAMLFRFAGDIASAFYTANVRFPLSIAWLGSDGAFISSADAPPCTGPAEQCPRYSAEKPYRYAIEVRQGDLPTIGLGPGSKMEVGGPCS